MYHSGHEDRPLPILHNIYFKLFLSFDTFVLYITAGHFVVMSLIVLTDLKQQFVL
jgi:hypothetical protein